jgi:hypothetical protein
MSRGEEPKKGEFVGTVLSGYFAQIECTLWRCTGPEKRAGDLVTDQFPEWTENSPVLKGYCRKQLESSPLWDCSKGYDKYEFAFEHCVCVE